MKKVHGIILGTACLLLAACNTPPGPANPNPPADTSSNATGLSDDEILALAKSYQDFPALNTELKRSATHNNMLVRTHLDAQAMEAYKTQSYPYPDGAEILKEGHMTKEGPIEALFIMKKIKGYDPENGDWFYAMTKGDSMVADKGKMQMCISCHTKIKNKDYIYGFDS